MKTLLRLPPWLFFSLMVIACGILEISKQFYSDKLQKPQRVYCFYCSSIIVVKRRRTGQVIHRLWCSERGAKTRSCFPDTHGVTDSIVSIALLRRDPGSLATSSTVSLSECWPLQRSCEDAGGQRLLVIPRSGDARRCTQFTVSCTRIWDTIKRYDLKQPFSS